MSAKLYFHYGCVSAGKSTALLQVARNYSDRGLRATILAPEVACASGVVRSRIGIEARATSLPFADDVFEVVGRRYVAGLSAVLVDEAQFLTAAQVRQFAEQVVDGLGVPVLCYGIRVDFRGDLFDGSRALLAVADKIIEIRTICASLECARKATMNLKVDEDRRAVRGGSVVDIAATYLPVCRRCWHEAMRKAKG